MTPTGGRPIISPSVRSICSTIPLLREPLKAEHIKPRLLGHWGTTPGLNFIYAHLNRLIKKLDLDMIYIAGPGHGGPGLVANTYLEGTYSEVYPDISQDVEGMKRLFTQFSFPGRHSEPRRAGNARLDSRRRRARLRACRTPTAPRSTIPISSSPASSATAKPKPGRSRRAGTPTSFSIPARDGAVLPILHLNGYKIADPTVLARIPHEELESLFRGYGYKPYFVEGRRPGRDAPADGRHARHGARRDPRHPGTTRARTDSRSARRWPMIVLRTPKGWTGPKVVDGKQVEGTLRAHQVPMSDMRGNPEHVRMLEDWMRSYRPEELFDENGSFDARARGACAERRLAA